jgi:hypothetical protein
MQGYLNSVDAINSKWRRDFSGKFKSKIRRGKGHQKMPLETHPSLERENETIISSLMDRLIGCFILSLSLDSLIGSPFTLFSFLFSS